MKGGPDTDSPPRTIIEVAPERYWKQGGNGAGKIRKKHHV